MRGWRSAGTLAAAALVALAAGTTQPAVARDVQGKVLFSFTDPDIVESSGLADGGPVLYTINDSGSGPVVYAVDKKTGNTVAATTFSAGEVDDTEAVAPGRNGSVWVGDIGDNGYDRDSVDVYHVRNMDRLRPSEPSVRYRMVYEDRPHDAEALLVHPVTGRIYVVTKELFGAAVYSAPSHLSRSRDNVLRRGPRVEEFVTDGTFFPDGRHVLLRGYDNAEVYTFPGFRQVATFPLPTQEQGEGIALGPDNAVYVSTEGALSQVREVALPPRVAALVASPSADPSSDSSATAAPSSGYSGSSSGSGTLDPSVVGNEKDPGDPLLTGDGAGAFLAGGLVLLVLAGWWFIVARRHGRRRA